MAKLTSQQTPRGWFAYGLFAPELVDPLGRLTSVTQLLNGNPLITSYGYDEVGNRISQTDANSQTTSYTYDQLGRRLGRTLPLGQEAVKK